MRPKGRTTGSTLTGYLASLTARYTPLKEAKNPKGHSDKGRDPQGMDNPREEGVSTPPPITASGWTPASGEAKDTGPPEADPNNKQARTTGGTHVQNTKAHTQAGPTGATHGQILLMDSAGRKNARPVREDDTDPRDTRKGQTGATGREREKIGGGPPLMLRSVKGGPAFPATLAA